MKLKMFANVTAIAVTYFFVLSSPLYANNATASDWQLKRLLQPSEQDLRLEQQHGKVLIYDGLYSKDIDQALNEQFGRIDHMMFVRVKVEKKNGEIDVQEDNCE